MKLWILRPIKGSKLWIPWYDKAFGFIIRANTEEDAREFAQQKGGNETGEYFKRDRPAWTDSENSTCTRLENVGEAGVIMADTHWG